MAAIIALSLLCTLFFLINVDPLPCALSYSKCRALEILNTFLFYYLGFEKLLLIFNSVLYSSDISSLHKIFHYLVHLFQFSGYLLGLPASNLCLFSCIYFQTRNPVEFFEASLRLFFGRLKLAYNSYFNCDKL